MVTQEEIEDAKCGGKAFEKLWQKERGMICFETFRDRSRMNTREDFELLAQVGLWRSVQSYDCSRGASYETWARSCMLSAIYSELVRTKFAPEREELSADSDRAVEPVCWELLWELLDDFGKQLSENARRVWQALRSDPSLREYEIAEHLGMSFANFSEIKRPMRRKFVEYLYG